MADETVDRIDQCVSPSVSSPFPRAPGSRRLLPGAEHFVGITLMQEEEREKECINEKQASRRNRCFLFFGRSLSFSRSRFRLSFLDLRPPTSTSTSSNFFPHLFFPKWTNAESPLTRDHRLHSLNMKNRARPDPCRGQSCRSCRRRRRRCRRRRRSGARRRRPAVRARVGGRRGRPVPRKAGRRARGEGVREEEEGKGGREGGGRRRKPALPLLCSFACFFLSSFLSSSAKIKEKAKSTTTLVTRTHVFF
jgi:hypothetical protein